MEGRGRCDITLNHGNQGSALVENIFRIFSIFKKVKKICKGKMYDTMYCLALIDA